MKPEIKKLLILNVPYLLFVYLFDKVGQAVRLAPGADMSAKLLSIGDGFSAAFSNAFPSVHPADLLIGIAGAVIVRLDARPEVAADQAVDAAKAKQTYLNNRFMASEVEQDLYISENILTSPEFMEQFQ